MIPLKKKKGLDRFSVEPGSVSIKWPFNSILETQNPLGVLDIIDGELYLIWITGDSKNHKPIKKILKIKSMEQLEALAAKRLLSENK